MQRGYALFTSLALLAVGFAGCFGSSSGFDAPGQVDGEDAAVIEGQVLDAELLPVAGALVAVQDTDFENTTDAEGVFQLGPVPAGEYTLVIEKEGYAPFQQLVVVRPDGGAEPVTAILTPVASDVPYHVSELFVTFVNCASRNLIGGTPCTALPDYVLGTNLSANERYAFQFVIPSPGLADMLVEMRWTEQALASDMLFKIQTPPGQPFTGLATSYVRIEGGQPLRGWVTANVDNDGDGPGAVFDAEPNNVTYEGLTIWSSGNATIPYTSFYINHRTDTWLTFFYNREGPRTFTALPDE